ncbi:MAG: gluconokinase [Chloroflexota bacterium]|nr:gluconokinase [Chloroflexota bacterium]
MAGQMAVTAVLMGVSGAGKSSLMAALVERAHLASAEGDDFHPQANVAKMRAGTPLTDADRWPWLRAIADWIGHREAASVDAVVTCSALRRAYRDVLRDGHPSVRFVHLTTTRIVLEERLAARIGHYMPGSLLASQLELLEPLDADEPGFEVNVDRPIPQLADEIARRLRFGVT